MVLDNYIWHAGCIILKMKSVIKKFSSRRWWSWVYFSELLERYSISWCLLEKGLS